VNQYLYRIQPVRPAMLSESPTEEESRLTGEHFNYLKDLMEKGQVILAGRTLDTGYDSFGIIIFRAENDADANALVQNDPAVKGRVFRAELHPYRIALLKAANVE
jgi:uncharacterized protein YciI